MKISRTAAEGVCHYKLIRISSRRSDKLLGGLLGNICVGGKLAVQRSSMPGNDPSLALALLMMVAQNLCVIAELHSRLHKVGLFGLSHPFFMQRDSLNIFVH